MRFSGNFLTWSNRQDNIISSKMDRMLVNAEWGGDIPDFEAEIANPRITLDHSYVDMRLVAQVHQNLRSFRFFNFWTTEDGFIETIRQAWSTNPRGNAMFVL